MPEFFRRPADEHRRAFFFAAGPEKTRCTERAAYHPALMTQRTGAGGVRLYAHRGASAELPENTLESFGRALELGADALETDVHMTADGVLVVAHDPDGSRTANDPRAIRDLPLEEVRRWDVGAGFVAPDGSRPFAGKGFRVPTLESLVTSFPVVVNIDMKQESPPIWRAVCELVDRLGAHERIQVASFHLRPLRALRAAGYPGRTSLAPPEVAALLALPAALFRRACRGASIAQLPTRMGRLELARPWVIDRARAAGLAIEFFTVNDPAEARALAELGPDGIMTDDPRAVAPALGKGSRS